MNFTKTKERIQAKKDNTDLAIKTMEEIISSKPTPQAAVDTLTSFQEVIHDLIQEIQAGIHEAQMAEINATKARLMGED